MKSTKPKAPVMIPVENLVPFDGHPYKVLDDDSMNDLTESAFCRRKRRTSGKS